MPSPSMSSRNSCPCSPPPFRNSISKSNRTRRCSPATSATRTVRHRTPQPSAAAVVHQQSAQGTRGSSYGNDLFTAGADRHEGDRYAGDIFDAAQVLERTCRQIGDRARLGGWCAPSRQGLVDRLHAVEQGEIVGEVRVLVTVGAIARADADLLEVVEHVELGQ